MMYKRNISKRSSRRYSDNMFDGRRRRRRKRLRRTFLSLFVAAVLLFVLASAFDLRNNLSFLENLSEGYVWDTAVSNELSDNDSAVFRKRIIRDEIPPVDFRFASFREVLNDSNYVQLSAARANGIKPDTLGNPAMSNQLVPIFSTSQYRVDTMYHSMPYLIPEAVLLLNYISQRFNYLMAKDFPETGKYKIIVTSALRTEHGERRLKRVNRNATDTSCHIYGTTFDISAQRFENEYGRDTVVENCRIALAQALYELRYEGLCYVKYERGSCFHTTLRTTQYDGNSHSKIVRYINPGSPAYLLTKAPPRPKAPAPKVSRKEKPVTAPKKQSPPKPVKTEQPKAKKQSKSSSTINTKPSANKPPETPVPPKPQKLSERERLSLEQFERRY